MMNAYVVNRREKRVDDTVRSKYAAIRREYEEKYRRAPAAEDEKRADEPSAPNYIDV